MKKYGIAMAVLAALVLAAALVAIAADDDDAGVKERAVTFEQLPAPVQKTVRAEAGTHELLEIEEITSAAGEISYDAEWRDGDQKFEINVAPDGHVIARETEAWQADEEDDD